MAQRFLVTIRLVVLGVVAMAFACAALASSTPATARPVHAGAPPNRLDPPSCPPCIGFPGSTLIVHNLYWDSNWDANNPAFPMATLDDFSAKLVTSPYLANIAQYGVTSYSFTGGDGPVGDCALTPPAPTFSYFDLSGWILCEKHHLPAARNATVWLVFPPTNTGQSSSCADGGASEGYHAETLPSIIPPDVPQTFALTTPQCDLAKTNPLDGLTQTASHEVVEAAIDALPGFGWIDLSTAGSLGFDWGNLFTHGEAGDICDFNPPAVGTLGRVGGGRYAVGYYWSNAAGACVPAADTVTLSSSGAPSTVSPTFDGTHVTLPFTTSVADGTFHDVVFPSPIADPAYPIGGRFVTDFSSGSKLVTGPVTFNATYIHQYMLFTNVSGGGALASQVGLTPSAWQTAGTTVTVSTNGIVPVGANRLRFTGWTGDATGTATSIAVLMDAPKSVVANYVLQHQISFTEAGIPAGVSWTITVNGTGHNGPFSDWFDSGSLVTFSYQSPVQGASGTRYVLASTSVPSPFIATAAATIVGIYDAPSTAVGQNFNATEGQSFTAPVAAISDSDASAAASEYTAMIAWGDGSSTATGVISGPTGGPFTVSGSHTYAEERSYSVTVTITDVDITNNTTTVTLSANVQDAGLTGQPVCPATIQSNFTGPTATFSDANPGPHLEDFTAVINWGDGSSSTGVISGSNPYTVSGAHVYTTGGPHTIATTITDVGVSTLTISCTGTTVSCDQQGNDQGQFQCNDQGQDRGAGHRQSQGQQQGQSG